MSRTPHNLVKFFTQFHDGLDANNHLIKKTGATFIIRGVSICLGIIVTVFLARFLGAEEFGRYSIIYALVMIAAAPLTSGLRNLVVREASKSNAVKSWDETKGLLSASLLLIAGLCFFYALIASLFFWWFPGWFDPKNSLTIIWGISLLPFFSLIPILGANLRAQGYVVAGHIPDQIARPALFLIFVATLVLSTNASLHTSDRAMMLNAGASLIVLVATSIWLARTLPFDFRTTKTTMKLGPWIRSLLPLCLITGMAVINTNTDLIMLGLLKGNEDAGVYRLAAQCATLIAFGLTCVNMLNAPLLARLHAKGETDAQQRLLTWSARIALIIALPLAALFILFGKTLLTWAAGTAFTIGATALAILSIGQLVNSFVGPVGQALNMTGHEKDTASVMAIAALANVVLNLVLIPYFGMNGAALATMLSTIFWNLLLYYRLKERTGLISLPFRRVA